MTVKELKEKLNQFNDNLIIMIPDAESPIGYKSLYHVAQGVNEADCALFLDAYDEEED